MAATGTVYINSDSNKEKHASPSKKELQKLDKLVDESNRIIYEVESAFPFQFFPDRLIIDENKITLIRKHLLFKRVYPIPYDNIATVRVNRTIFFASLEFEVTRFTDPPNTLTHLIPSKAAKAKRYITGIMQAKKEGVDLTKLTMEDLRIRLEKIGGSANETIKLI